MIWKRTYLWVFCFCLLFFLMIKRIKLVAIINKRLERLKIMTTVLFCESFHSKVDAPPQKVYASPFISSHQLTNDMIDDTNTVVLYYVHSIKAAKLADILWHRSQFSNQAPADVEKTPSWNIQTTSYNLFDYFLYLNFLWFCQRNWNQTSYWIYHKVFYILSPWLVTVGIGKQEGQV